MARVTVEDCVLKVENRFELVLMAAERAKDLERGATPTVSRENDKSTIIALREIAEETISLEGLKELAKKNLAEESSVFQETDDSVVQDSLGQKSEENEVENEELNERIFSENDLGADISIQTEEV